MAQAKTQSFEPALIRAAGLAKALAHPVRIRILEILAGRRSCVCGGLVDLLPLAQSTVSQHIRELRDAGLIHGEIDGKRTCYCLDPEAVAEAQAVLVGLFLSLGATPEDGPAGRPPKACRACAPGARALRSRGRGRGTRSAKNSNSGKEKP